jgi:hypothetical protein
VFLRIIFLSIIAYFVLKFVRSWFLGAPTKTHFKQKDEHRDDDIQKRYGDKIEDADFEELE